MNVYRTMVVPIAHVARARELASKIAPGTGANMWVRKLSLTEDGVPTHYISDGWIREEMAALLDDSGLLYTAAQKAKVAITQLEVTTLLTASTVKGPQWQREVEPGKVQTFSGPHSLVQELGLKFVKDTV